MSQGNTDDRAKVFAFPSLYAITNLIIGLAIHNFVYELSSPRWLGAVLLAISIPLIILPTREFRKAGENERSHTPTNTLIETGPYRFSRNPIYVTLLILQSGLSLLLGTWWGLLMAPLAWLMYHYLAVLPEEAYLEQKLGDEYVQYKQRVRRWI